MTIAQLRMLGYLAECGSISRTAEICYLSQSALTRQLRSMEEELGYPLFTRSFSGILLTPAGKVFCEATRGLLAQYDRAVCLGREACQQQTGLTTLRIGVFSYSLGFIVSMFKECETLLPHIHFEFIASRIPDNCANLRENRLDLCFPAEQSVEQEDIAFERLLTSRNCMRIPEGNPLYGRRQVSFADLHGHAVLMMPRGMAGNSDRLRAYIMEHHPQIRIIDYNNPIEAEAEALVRGHILMTLGFFEPKKGFSFAVLSDFPGVALGAQYRKEDAALVAPVLDTMRSYLARQPLEPFLSAWQGEYSGA